MGWARGVSGTPLAPRRIHVPNRELHNMLGFCELRVGRGRKRRRRDSIHCVPVHHENSIFFKVCVCVLFSSSSSKKNPESYLPPLLPRPKKKKKRETPFFGQELITKGEKTRLFVEEFIGCGYPSSFSYFFFFFWLFFFYCGHRGPAVFLSLLLFLLSRNVHRRGGLQRFFFMLSIFLQKSFLSTS